MDLVDSMAVAADKDIAAGIHRAAAVADNHRAAAVADNHRLAADNHRLAVDSHQAAAEAAVAARKQVDCLQAHHLADNRLVRKGH